MGLKDNFKQAARELAEGPWGGSQQAEIKNEHSATPQPFDLSEVQEKVAQDQNQSVQHRDDMVRVTVIAAGTVIQGSIQSEGSLELYGEVQGDIICKKDMKLRGRLKGNVSGANIEIQDIRLEGAVQASAVVQVDQQSTVEGDIYAQSLILDGRVKGNVRVSNKLTIRSHGMIQGGVEAERLVVEEGAIVQGEIQIGSKSQSKGQPPQPAK